MKNEPLGTVLVLEDELVGRGQDCWEAGEKTLSCSSTCPSGCGSHEGLREDKHRACPASPKACSFITWERNFESNKYPMEEDWSLSDPMFAACC